VRAFSDEDLAKMMTVNSTEYTPEALAIATEEATRRGGLADLRARLPAAESKDGELVPDLLPEELTCPHCETTLSLDKEEQLRKIFVCGECGMQSDFSQPVRMFSNVFSIKGRIRRLEYGLSVIIQTVIFLVLGVVEDRWESDVFVLYIFPAWFSWAQGAKRCHDLGNSGWFQVIPFYGFWLIFAEGTRGWNEYGRDPKN
jgi:uncharacterized membrane protein YhaH (DUF805 family)